MSMKICSMCEQEKPEAEYWSAGKNGKLSHCIDCCRDNGQWTYDAYSKLHQIQPEEEYIVGKLAEQPTLLAGLDELYRRMPIRWHQLAAAATIKRREGYRM